MYKYIITLLLFFLCANGFTQEKNTLSKKLIAYWDFDRDSIFGSKNKKFQIFPKNKIDYEKGIKGKCISLKEENYVKVKSGFNLYGSFTVNFWFKPNKIKGTHCLFLQAKKQKYDITRFFEIGITNEHIFGDSIIMLYVKNNDEKNEFTSPYCNVDSIKINKWTHLACTYDGCSLKLFIDGTEIYKEQNILFNIREPQIKDVIFFGTGPYEAFPFFGLMDEIMLHQRALNTNEIKQISNKKFPNSNFESKKIHSRKKRFCGHNIFTKRKTILNKGLIAYWDFDENTWFGLNKFLKLKKVNDAKLIKSDLKEKALFIPKESYCETKNGAEIYNNFTIICNLKTKNTEQQTIFTQYKKDKDDKILRSIELGIIDKKVYFKNYNNKNNDTTFFIGDTITYDKWNFVILSISGCNGKLAINSTKEFKEFKTSMQISESQYKDIIRFGTDALNEFNYSGYIDEFMIYDKMPDTTMLKLISEKKYPSSFHKKKRKKEIIKIFDKDTLKFVKNYKYAKGNSVIIDTIYVSSVHLRFQLQDYDKFDFDRLRIFTGKDTTLEENIMLKKGKKNIDFEIDPNKNNYIFFHALNTGTEWVNTSYINTVSLNKDVYYLSFFRKILYYLFGVGKKEVKGENLLEAEKGENSIIKIIYEPDISEYGFEKSAKSRETKIIRKHEIKTDSLTIKIWDYDMTDDDIISITLNDKFILNKYTLTKTPETINLKLDKGDNTLTFYSVSKGKKGDNTTKISIKVGDKKFGEPFDIITNDDKNIQLQFDVKKD